MGYEVKTREFLGSKVEGFLGSFSSREREGSGKLFGGALSPTFVIVVTFDLFNIPVERKGRQKNFFPRNRKNLKFSEKP